jgi:hypothetical protein
MDTLFYVMRAKEDHVNEVKAAETVCENDKVSIGGACGFVR